MSSASLQLSGVFNLTGNELAEMKFPFLAFFSFAGYSSFFIPFFFWTWFLIFHYFFSLVFLSSSNELGAFTNTIVELYATLDDDRLDSKTKIAKFMNLKELTLHFGAMYSMLFCHFLVLCCSNCLISLFLQFFLLCVISALHL